MRYFTKCTCIEDVKEEYRRLAKMLHPDNGGDAEEFKRMMQAYTSAYNRFKGVHRKQTDKSTQGAYTSPHDDFSAEQFADIINKVIGLDGVEIEIVGTWIWLGGNTFIYKDRIKAAGFFWSSKHKKWYYNGSTKKSKKHSKMSYSDICNLHGVYSVNHGFTPKLT